MRPTLCAVCLVSTATCVLMWPPKESHTPGPVSTCRDCKILRESEVKAKDHRWREVEEMQTRWRRPIDQR